MRYSILFTVLICYLAITWCQPPDTTFGAQPPDQSTSVGTCSTSNIAACTCDQSDKTNCDILQDEFGILNYDVDCDYYYGHCTIWCDSNADCTILAAGGYDTECDGIYCIPRTSNTQAPQPSDRTTSRPQPPDRTTSRPQPPDQTGSVGACSTSNITACTCTPDDFSNCQILRDEFEFFDYYVDCDEYYGHCTIWCDNDTDCAILAAGGYDTECDGWSCIPRSDQTTSRPQSTEQTETTETTTPCNSIQFEYQFESFPFLVPEYVCWAEKTNNVEHSKNFVCDEQGGAIMNVWADNFDCSGTPTRTEDPCYDLSLDAIDSECAYTAYCGGEICTYVAVEEYEGVTECDGDIPATDAFTNHSSAGMVFDLDACLIYLDDGNGSMSIMYQCTASGLTMSGWSGTDCAGDPVIDVPIFANGCSVTQLFVLGESTAVDCNAVATKPTTAADDDDDDDAYGVKVSSFMTLFAVSLYFIAN